MREYHYSDPSGSAARFGFLARSACEAVFTAAEEFQEAQVAKDLELLPDFGLDVVIAGVELSEGLFLFVDFLEREFLFVKSFYDLQNV